MTPDREAWIRAGGDAHRLDLYASIGEVAPFADGDSRVLASIHPERPDVGALGDWVGGMDVLRAGEDWLRERGCKVARGPMELCRWFEHRAAVGPFDEPAFSFESITPAGRWIDAEYHEIERYASLVADRDTLIRSTVDRAAALAARGFTLRPLSADLGDRRPSELFRERLDAVHRIFSEAYAEGDDEFVSIPADALYRYYAPHEDAIDPRLTILAQDPSGEPVGVVVALPDRAVPERRWYLVPTMAVLPSHRHLGVGRWLLAAAHQAGRKAGYEAGVHCFVHLRGHEDSSAFYAGRIFRRYVLLEKSLT